MAALTERLHTAFERLDDFNRPTHVPFADDRDDLQAISLELEAAVREALDEPLGNDEDIDPAATHPPSPLESSPDDAADWSIDAAMAERAARDEER